MLMEKNQNQFTVKGEPSNSVNDFTERTCNSSWTASCDRPAPFNSFFISSTGIFSICMRFKIFFLLKTIFFDRTVVPKSI